MTDDDLFFVSRGRHIWACWLSGKPAVDLGVDTEVTQAMTQFLRELRALVVRGASIETLPPPLYQAAPVVPPSIPLAPRPSVIRPRAADRHDLTILGRIFTARGSRDVTILDLSETGCQFHAAGS